MLAIWRAVQEQIHVHGAKSVRQACDQLFNRRAKGLIKFTDKAGNVIDKIDDDAGAETLRQRYYTAEKARKQPEKYPMLAARTAQLAEVLPGTHERMKAMGPEMRWRKATNNWLDDYPG
ncbi:MAG: hypothetical protein V4794_19520 [Pseudomonadota bacterium]